jgi:hypothetical protein
MPDLRYAHGPGHCRDCFSAHDNNLKEMGDWRLHNNPGYYGSPSPETLILGFSKGANQNKAAALGDFDKIAFAGARHRLKKVLEVLGLMPKDRSIDHLMTAKEPKFGVASLVRCSFCKMKDGNCKTSGDVVPSAFTNSETIKVIERCASKHLAELPSSAKRVILLGNGNPYVTKTSLVLKHLHRDYRQINEMAFQVGNALWIYAAHPSPGNGHFESWATGTADSTQGRKRQLAIEALNSHRI